MFPETCWLPPDSVASTDSCLGGCGGWCEGEYFHCLFPVEFMSDSNIAINELECFAIVLALKVWKQKTANCNVLLQCDNETTVQVINKGKAHNTFTQQCSRELAWLSAWNNTWIKVCFISGVNNRIPDYLSRFHLHDKYRKLFLEETEGLHKKEVFISEAMYSFEHLW